MQNEFVEEKRREDEAVKHRRLERSLEKRLDTPEKGLEDTFLGSYPIDVTQPPPSVLEQAKK